MYNFSLVASVRRVKKILTKWNKNEWFSYVLEILQRCYEEYPEFLGQIITVDETRVYHKTSELKHWSLHWKRLQSAEKCKVLTSFDRL